MGKFNPTGVTGFVIEGNYGRSVTIYDTDEGFVAVDRVSLLPDGNFDPFLSQWITQRAVSSAAIRAGLKDKLSLVRLDKISAELRKDKRAVIYTTEEFVKKMDPKRAANILAGLVTPSSEEEEPTTGEEAAAEAAA